MRNGKVQEIKIRNSTLDVFFSMRERRSALCLELVLEWECFWEGWSDGHSRWDQKTFEATQAGIKRLCFMGWWWSIGVEKMCVQCKTCDRLLSACIELLCKVQGNSQKSVQMKEVKANYLKLMGWEILCQSSIRACESSGVEIGKERCDFINLKVVLIIFLEILPFRYKINNKKR